MRRKLAATPILVIWALPLVAGLFSAVYASGDPAAWRDLFAHPQLWPALGLSLWTGTASTAAALLCALIIAAGFHRSPLWQRLQLASAAGLAIPHLAFAIGFGFLIMPSGWLARLVAGGDTPPQWVTTQDPYGLSLIAALVLKEIPFFVAMIWSVLARGDAAASLEGQWRTARSLGHGGGSVWLRVILPQLLPWLTWPIVIVWVYGATVVDMALVIGPTQPPTLGVILWNDLNDATAAMNARGLTGALFLTLVLAGIAAAALLISKPSSSLLRNYLVRGPSRRKPPEMMARFMVAAALLAYLATVAILVLMPLAPRWPYPLLWPPSLQMSAWSHLAADGAALLLSLGLGLATSLCALTFTVLWFESQPQRRDILLLGLALAALGLPQLVTASGQYMLFLKLNLTATLMGLFLAHLTPVAAYTVIVLAGPYRAFDPRFTAVARSLQSGPWRLWWRVKAPLLRGPLLTAAAVGFSVSMVQFVPAQLIAAGRFATLPMEAVTLSSGGNRALTAVYALVLTLPPLAVFALAGVLGRPRWR